MPASCVGGDEEPTVRVEDLLVGKEDALLLANLDPFQMALVESLSSRRLEVVVTQKYACGRKTSDTAREVGQNQDGVIVSTSHDMSCLDSVLYCCLDDFYSNTMP